MPNDDLDVTIGIKIVVTISNCKEDLYLNSFKQTPLIIENNDCKMFIYASKGVGIVTKDGIKPKKGSIALNPKPLQVITDIFINKTKNLKKTIYCSIGAINGEKIAKNTANEKVGVVNERFSIIRAQQVLSSL